MWVLAAHVEGVAVFPQGHNSVAREVVGQSVGEVVRGQAFEGNCEICHEVEGGIVV